MTCTTNLQKQPERKKQTSLYSELVSVFKKVGSVTLYKDEQICLSSHSLGIISYGRRVVREIIEMWKKLSS